MGLDFFTEEQQGGVYVRHPGQIPRLHRGVERLGQVPAVQLDEVVVTAQIVRHLRDITAVAGGLEFACRKVFLVFRIVHGKGLKQFPLRAEPAGGHGGDQAGIQPAGEKGAHRHIGDQLAFNGVQHQVAYMLHGLLKALGVLLSVSRQ